MLSIIESVRSQLTPVNREGYPFIGAFALAALILFWVWSPLGWLGVIATAWCAYFFRDPPRITPLAEGVIVAPADGTICFVGPAVPPAEMGLGTTALPRVSIFMSVFNVHVNRSPVSGRVERMVYRPGLFLNADLDKASDDNERNALVIASLGGMRIGVVQIAGLIARRIVPLRQGRGERRGRERIGMIRFGSRVDVYLPEGTKAHVAEGQTMIAGETVIADLSVGEWGHSFRME